LVSRKVREQIARARVKRILESGQVRKSIDLLLRENRRRPSALLEETLVRVRHEGFFKQSFPAGLREWPPPIGQRFADHDGIPDIDRSQMSADIIRDGVFNRGSIIIRGLLPENDVRNLREGIEKTYQHHDMAMAGASSAETTPWFVPFQPSDAAPDKELNRPWYREGGAALAADSPRGLFNLIECFERNSIIDLVSEYLGERPCLSVRKTSLRKIPCDLNAENGWHQDGAFLGQNIRTMNLWVALSDCGIDAPSMDMVPRRLDYIVPTGTEGAVFDWSVSTSQIKEACAGGEPAHLLFKAGDAIIFDEMNLHRTSALPGMTKPRYAIEAWFFAPSCYPLDQLPLLV
jgi:hypothetical protein